MATNEEVIDAIATNLAQPRRARTDAGEVEQHELDLQVEAAKFVLGQRAVTSSASPWLSMRFTKAESPGGIG